MAIHFRSIFLEEPPKNELINFLDLEHSGKVTTQTPRPARLAKVQYDVVRGDKKHEYMESWVDVVSGKEVEQRIVDKIHHASLTTYDAFLSFHFRISDLLQTRIQSIYRSLSCLPALQEGHRRIRPPGRFRCDN